MREPEEIVRTACPRDCYDTCGVAVHKRNGVIEAVRGDPGHFVSRGQLCPKCSIGYNNEWLDPRVRLTRPLRRDWDARARAVSSQCHGTPRCLPSPTG